MNIKKHSNDIDMLHGPLIGKLLLFSLPLMLSSILQLLFNASDVIIVGRFAGNESLAAVGSTGPVINLLVNLFVGLSVGANVVAARFIGSGNNIRASQTVHTSVFLSIIAGIFLMIAGIMFSRQILELMGSPDDVINLAALYLKIYFFGMPALMMYNFGSALLRAQGDTQRPLIYLAIAGVINIIINLFSVIVLKMGVAGVAIATVISQYISGFLVFKCLIKEQGILHLDIKKLRIHKSCLKDILIIGLPAGFQGVVFSLSNVVIQSTINSFGSVVMAGSAAAANIEGFVYVAMNAFHQTATTFCSQNYGAKQLKRVDKVLIYCQLLCIAVGVILGNSAVFFGKPLLSVYSQSGDVIAAGQTRMQYICRLYAICGFMDVFVGALRGIGYSVTPMIVSLLGACGLRLLWIAFIFPLNPTQGMLYASYPITWGITGFVHLICYIILRQRVSKKINSAQ